MLYQIRADARQGSSGMSSVEGNSILETHHLARFTMSLKLTIGMIHQMEIKIVNG